MTPAARRPTLIPRWLIATLVAIGLFAVALGGFLVVRAGSRASVTVPAIEGLDAPVARSRLAQAGLLMVYGDTRFSSDIPAGGVLEQDPSAGADVEPGTVITVDLSAGAESFIMPDITSMHIDAARSDLEARGLVVELESAPSDTPQGTVIASVPAPGVEVRTGSVVRLTVSGEVGADVLLPADLQGRMILLDPAPPTAGRADVAMEVTRHLRSLLEASGADVLVSRSIVETNAPPAARAAWATEASASIALGFDTGPDGELGRSVFTLPSDPSRADSYLASVDLARTLTSYLNDAEMQARLSPPAEDVVLDAAATVGVRVLLGDPELPENVDAFSDPAWVDEFARAVYRAVVAALTG
jgi:hypothetical protein